MNARVSIIGASALGAPGIGREEVWKGMKTSRNSPNLRRYEMYDGTTINFPVYEMPPLDLKDWLARAERRWIEQEGLDKDPDFVFMLVAALLAIDEACLSKAELSKSALVIGHENPGINPFIDKILQSQNHMLQQGVSPLTSFEQHKQDIFRLQTFPYLFYLAKLLGIQGVSYITNNACASGLYAMELGRQIIQQGQAESVVVVCADYVHATEYLWLGDKGFHSPRQILKPFDSERDGSVLGDGAAAIVMTSSEKANAGGRELGTYLGGAFQQDGWNLSLPNVASHSYSSVISRAMQHSNLKELDLLIPHGTGMQMWDAYEVAEIARAFADLKMPLPQMTALKGYFGHTLGANTLLEIVCMLESMEQGVIPPAANYSSHHFKIDLPMTTRWESRSIKTAVKCVSAFGGFLAAGVFEKN